MSAAFWNNFAVLCFSGAAAFFAVAVTLFFRSRIPETVRFLSGKRKREGVRRVWETAREGRGSAGGAGYAGDEKFRAPPPKVREAVSERTALLEAASVTREAISEQTAFLDAGQTAPLCEPEPDSMRRVIRSETVIHIGET